MTKSSSKSFPVLIASDGSAAARAAMTTAMRFPWPEPSSALAVVAARRVMSSTGIDFFEEAWRMAVEQERVDASDVLRKRWPAAKVATPDRSPVDAILGEARRLRAGAIVLGWRGHGLLQRFMLGSVSREVVRRSRWPVLVVRSAPRSVRRIVLGYDNSPQARKAVRLLAASTPPRGNRLVLVSVVEQLRPMSISMLPKTVRASVAQQVDDENHQRMVAAGASVEKAAAALKAAGWKVEVVVKGGIPLDTLLSSCDQAQADVLVLGARAKRGVERALLGSVANGALSHAGIPVLIVP